MKYAQHFAWLYSRHWWLMSILIIGCLVAFPSHAQQLPGLVSQPTEGGGQQWSLSTNTAALKLVGVLASNAADDDQLYPHHHCTQPAKDSDGYSGYAA